MRFAPFAFPLRTAVATPGVPSVSNARQHGEARSIHRAPALWTTLWNRRGEPGDTPPWAVDEVGTVGVRNTPYPGMTSGDADDRSSTGCGQEIVGASGGVR